MIENILFIDYSVANMDFQEGKFKPKSGGTFRYDVARSNEIEISEKQGDEFLHFIDTMKISVNAENADDEKSKAFQLEVIIQLVYQALEKDRQDLTEEFIGQHDWFFKNFSFQVAHDVVVKILNETKFRSASNLIPRYRIDEDSHE